ncbi:hypothetical protein AA313_de0204381 [Arthrobotrys entomopaga]|nr:hypothetical protein AA313_de0204381 [Arthrobotrys entomopaga]
MSKYYRDDKTGPKYAVAKGRSTGIFKSYKDEVHPSTNQYPSNIYQKFDSQQAAERALDTSGRYFSRDGPQYAVKNGYKPGIYPDWYASVLRGCPYTANFQLLWERRIKTADQVLGYPNNEHRRFNDYEAAARWMNDNEKAPLESTRNTEDEIQPLTYSLGRLNTQGDCRGGYDNATYYPHDGTVAVVGDEDDFYRAEGDHGEKVQYEEEGEYEEGDEFDEDGYDHGADDIDCEGGIDYYDDGDDIGYDYDDGDNGGDDYDYDDDNDNDSGYGDDDD